MQKNSIQYIVGFAFIVCVICSALVSSTAVLLKDKQDVNKLLDKQKKVLAVAGLIAEGSRPSVDEVQAIFDAKIDIQIIDMTSGTITEDSGITDPLVYNQKTAAKDPAISYPVDTNKARVKRIPNHVVMYTIKNDQGEATLYVLPVEGMGLWGTMYGFIALDIDGNTIQGLTFYQHIETPGLGAEVDNPSWKAKWPGRLVYGESGDVAIKVIKGVAASAEEAPHSVDGLSGATLTSNGVTNLLRFWLGNEGFGPLLTNLTAEGNKA